MAAAAHIPWRSGLPAPRPDDLPLPPGRMPMLRSGRPRKHWRYVGVFGEEVMACAAIVHVGPVTQSFWAIWDRRQPRLLERTTPGRGGIDLADGRVGLRRGDAAIALCLAPFGDAVQVVSPHGRAHIWTRKQWARATGTITAGDRTITVDAPALIDDSDGYHARETTWRWAAGAGTLVDGRAAGWNLTTGIHDGAQISERTVWIDGAAQPVEPVTIGDDLGTVAFADGAQLRFAAEAQRSRTENLLLIFSRYRQPFGAVSGSLPGGLELASGCGVMEDHVARW